CARGYYGRGDWYFDVW
nr:immunoglobulin heavy chain junction region [Mus musculus]